MNISNFDDRTPSLAPPADYLTWKSQCVEHFNHDAAHYDQEFLVKLLKEREMRAFRLLLPVAVRDTPALDFGSGTGRQVFELAQRGWRVDAFEAAPNMRHVLLRKVEAQGGGLAPKVRIFSDETEIAASRYLLVSSIGVMDYYPQPQMLLQQLRRAVAPGGYVMVSFPDRLSALAWLYCAGSFTVARLRVFLHSGRAVRRAGEQLGMQFVAASRSPFDYGLGGMLTFMLFRAPSPESLEGEQGDRLNAIPGSRAG